WGRKRHCLYRDGTRLESGRRPGREWFRITGDRAEGIRETAWEAILSALGEALDRRGVHRVHALGVECGGYAGLVVLPSGGGKSTLACLLSLTQGPVRILSEETPLLRNGWVYPFPLRLGLTPETALRFHPDTGRPFPRRRFPAKLIFPIQSARVA